MEKEGEAGGNYVEKRGEESRGGGEGRKKKKIVENRTEREELKKGKMAQSEGERERRRKLPPETRREERARADMPREPSSPSPPTNPTCRFKSSGSITCAHVEESATSDGRDVCRHHTQRPQGVGAFLKHQFLHAHHFHAGLQPPHGPGSSSPSRTVPASVHR